MGDSVFPEVLRSSLWRPHPPDAGMADDGDPAADPLGLQPRGYHNTYVYQVYLGWTRPPRDAPVAGRHLTINRQSRTLV